MSDRFIATRTPTGKPVTHGTTNAYGSYGCRCEPCREAQLEAGRRFRAAHPGYGNTRAKAYTTAEATLRERHRAEFDELHQAERAKLGLPHE